MSGVCLLKVYLYLVFNICLDILNESEVFFFLIDKPCGPWFPVHNVAAYKELEATQTSAGTGLFTVGINGLGWN